MDAINRFRAAMADLERNNEEFPFTDGAAIIVRERNLQFDLMYDASEDEHGADEQPVNFTLFEMRCLLDEIAELTKRPPVEKPAEPTEIDPGKRYLQMLAEWQDFKTKLAYYKEQEKEYRVILFQGAFPSPVEGTQKIKLPDGRTIKGQYKLNRKIDEAALPATLAHMRSLGVANTDVLVSYKPTLAKREWNTLSEEFKLAFSSAIIATPGTPTLDIELPKGLK